MTLGEFKKKVANVPDDYNLIMSIYSNIDGTDFYNEVDTMGCTVKDETEEVLIAN